MRRSMKTFIYCASLVLLATLSLKSYAALQCGDYVSVGVFTPGLNGGFVQANGDAYLDSQGHPYVPNDPAVYAGEFLITNLSNGEAFKTFCLQLNVDIHPYLESYNPSDEIGKYQVTSISNVATGGGDNSVVTDATKWLWVTYLDPDTHWSGSDVQQAIWILQGTSLPYVNPLDGSQLTAYSDAAYDLAKMANDAVAAGDAQNLEVSALNLMEVVSGETGQSMLVMQYAESFSKGATPEPMSLAIWGGLSMIGFVVGRRQMRRTK